MSEIGTTEKPRTTRPVTPRNAASLVIVREGKRPGPEGVEVLMGRRASKHRFMPHMFAFPGGRVDPADMAAEPLTPFRPEVFAGLTRKTTARLAQALGVAAIRETYEETGLRIGQLEGDTFRANLGALDYFVRAITPPASPIRFHARFFTVWDRHVEGEIGGSGELLDLAYRPIEDCLKLPLVDITDFVLRNLATRLANPDAPPFIWHYRSGGPVFRADR